MTQIEKVGEKDITDALHRHYNGNNRYRLANAYIFKRDWESDFFVQKQNGYCYEFEVKISRSDFFADRKKVDKHMILEHGKFIQQGSIWNPDHTSNEDRWIKTEKEQEHTMRPNKFYYVVPSGMITINELPSYAGLMSYDNGSISSVKEAPFIHKNKLDLSSVLVDKFQAYWLNEKFQNRLLLNEIQLLNYKIETLKSQLPNL